jgi:hypothetical protein
VTAPGRTIAAAVHRPLAEQLVALAGLRDGERVLALTAGDGELERALRAGRVDVALEVVHASSAADGATGVALEVVDAAPAADGATVASTALPFTDGGFDVALSLLAAGDGDALLAALGALGRVARRVRVVVWEGGATHENALRAAWDDAGAGSAPPVRLAVAPVALPAGWSRSVLADVARFDSARQLLEALTSERGVEVPAALAPALLRRFEELIAPHTAADGTLRVPVRAGLLVRG